MSKKEKDPAYVFLEAVKRDFDRHRSPTGVQLWEMIHCLESQLEHLKTLAIKSYPKSQSGHDLDMGLRFLTISSICMNAPYVLNVDFSGHLDET